MDDICAPQWTDFTRSPQVPSEDYFDRIHETHEPFSSHKRKGRVVSKTDTMLELTNVFSTVKIGTPVTRIEKQSLEKTVEKEQDVTKNNVSLAKKPQTVSTNLFAFKKSSKVIVSAHRRQSLKYRRRSNKYMSLAEAISKFHNQTPDRFRTISNKNKKHLMHVKRSPLKLTTPVSPALRSLSRTRPPVSNLKMHDEVQHDIKHNTLNMNNTVHHVSLKNPSGKSNATSSHTNGVRKTIHSVQLCQKKIPEKPMDTVVKNDKIVAFEIPNTSTVKPEPAICKNEAGCTDSSSDKVQVTEQKLEKPLNQSNAKITATPREKPEMAHNKLQVKEHSARKSVVPCPFSFAERDRRIAEKKKELAKQVHEEDKNTRVFHAKPAPTFKPVLVRGTSKENLRVKDKPAAKVSNKPVQHEKCDRENRQPNIIITHATPKVKPDQQKSVSAKRDVNVQENKKTEDAKNKRSIPRVLQWELNTDKRARERRKFEEKMRQKELEEEMRRKREEEDRIRRENMEKAELRKLAERKAQPMPVFKPPTIAKSKKPLTVPQSPAWASK